MVEKVKPTNRHFKIVTKKHTLKHRVKSSLECLKRLGYLFIKGDWLCPKTYTAFEECAHDDPEAVAQEILFVSDTAYNLGVGAGIGSPLNKKDNPTVH